MFNKGAQCPLIFFIMRLDSYSKYPSGMEDYLESYGWHFSKKMSDWAASKMYRKVADREKYITPFTKETFDDLLKKYSISIKKNKGYDYIYIANMCRADFYGSSVRTEEDLARFVKDVIEDPDAYEGMPFTRFYADCIGSGTPINWEDMI